MIVIFRIRTTGSMQGVLTLVNNVTWTWQVFFLHHRLTHQMSDSDALVRVHKITHMTSKCRALSNVVVQLWRTSLISDPKII